MSQKNDRIPFYAADGSPLGYRTVEAAHRLLASGHVNGSYGRKGHLKAIFLQQPDGASPVEARPRIGTRYSFLERLESGRRKWRHKRLDVKDEDGTVVSARGVRAGGPGVPAVKSTRRQVGARYLARVRGAFRPVKNGKRRRRSRALAAARW